MQRPLLARARRALRKPPRVLARRLVAEANVHVERVRAPRRASRLDEQRLLRALGAPTIDVLWTTLATRPYPAATTTAAARAIVDALPGELEQIVAAADAALERRVDVLGSGPVVLGRPIDWHQDVKTGTRWAPAYWRSIDYADLDAPSDVKVPWEISRLQWLLPAAQAHLAVGGEAYPRAAREIVEEWIDANPYSASVNWACAMEPALRVLTLTYLFHAFHASTSWQDEGFRMRFLRTLFLHGDFVARNLERSEVNGNHYTADAAGLVFAGLFFGQGRAPEAWAELGWSILADELPRQVYPDGVDFEASTAYHRLVLELFCLAARYRRVCGLPVGPAYDERLRAMARFSAAYSRPDGTSPNWGDADDARALPLGTQALGDHRYLAELVGRELGDDELAAFGDRSSEAAWIHGSISAASDVRAPGASTAFADGGVYVLRGRDSHVFVDCGPVGLAGRGGHGHNDCLGFEAWLHGTHVVTDCGSFVYTASAEWRNRFRSTGFHNTPQVDGEEQNRFVHPSYLWFLHDDATPELRRWAVLDDVTVFTGSHTGYLRLPRPVRPVRTIALEHERARLTIWDRFEGDGEHEITIPIHLAPGVSATELADGAWELEGNGRRFALTIVGTGWTCSRAAGWFSPSYGRKTAITRLVLAHEGPLDDVLVTIGEPGDPIEDVDEWRRKLAA